jgi:hypothetical protein
MIGRQVALFGRQYVWELYGCGTRNVGTPQVETVTQWRLEPLHPACGAGHRGPCPYGLA